VSSSSVIPFDDPTILFTNAGMNQFKDIFTGKRKADYPRATSCQKCIRAGGKHNDLDNVGFTARHHTFFEMLGNFSFGDYFKEEAIYYAWEWITKVLELPTDRLYATVYETDDEAFRLWKKIALELKNNRILRFGKKDNYWSMGAVGPCGPCSEIHYDRGAKFGNSASDVVNGETDRFVEIWNLVFMQYDQQPDGKLIALPKPSVDTGAGLERLGAIMQNVDSNYGIDLFRNLIRAISELTKKKYEENKSSHQVIADHLRALTFAIADGAGISNKGRGYVLRRILRRAAYYGYLLEAKEPFIYKLVPALVNEMGDVYPEIKEKQSHIVNVIKIEEELFGRTLATGMEIFEKISEKTTGKIIDGKDAFLLYDTYGFPYDLTEIMAAKKGMTLDKDGFEKAMARQKEQSKLAISFTANKGEKLDKFIDSLETQGLQKYPATEFVRDNLTINASLLIGVYDSFPEVAIVLDKTPFYVEAGGQVGDTGVIKNDSFTMEVSTINKYQQYYIHQGKVTRGTVEDLKKSDSVNASVDAERRWDIMRNHTATHLTHAALRKVLGSHVKQSGSYVESERLRFDFSHHKPMTSEEISTVEEIVNSEILKGTEVTTEIMDIEAARKSGAMALFGEKYEEEVRVVSVGDFSKELCGGMHVANVNQIGPFFITMETGVASGVRRIEAITGREAIKFMLQVKQFRTEVSQLVKRPEEDTLSGVQQLLIQNSTLQKELKKVKEQMFSSGNKTVGEEQKIGAVVFVTHNFGNTDRDIMSSWIDAQKAQNKPVFVIGLGNVNGKLTYIAAASKKAVEESQLDAGKISKKLLFQFEGRGGRKVSFGQGSLPADIDVKQFFQQAKKLLSSQRDD